MLEKIKAFFARLGKPPAPTPVKLSGTIGTLEIGSQVTLVPFGGGLFAAKGDDIYELTPEPTSSPDGAVKYQLRHVATVPRRAL